MVTKKDTKKEAEKQGKNKKNQNRDRVISITAETPYGLCSERLSSFGGLAILVKFLSLINVKEVFNELYVKPVRKTKLGCYKMVLGILIMLFIGYQRISHIASIRKDPIICGILRVSILPVVSTFWRYLRSLGEQQATSILEIMRELRSRVWHITNYHPHRIRVNIDTTVSTVYGDIEKAHKGHNSKHRGKKGYRPVLCFIDETREYLCGGQRTGKSMNKKESGRYIRQIRQLLPAGIKHVLISGDAEFLGWDSIAECEKAGYWYIYANKRCKPVFPKNGWYRYKGYEYNECYHHPEGWEHPCRFVAMRIREEEQQESLFPEVDYTYRVFITNRITRPHNVITEYDKRADVENSIKEAQSEGIMAIPSKKFINNRAFFQLAMFSYNIWRWIKLIAACSETKEDSLSSKEIKKSREHQDTIRTSRLKKLYVPAKLTFHENRGNILYSTYDVRSAGVMDFLDYLDRRRKESVCWPQLPKLRDTG